MNAISRTLALACVVFVPFARDAFELPHAFVLAAGVVLAGSSSVSREVRWVFGALGFGAVVTTLTSVSPSLSFPGLVTFLSVALFASGSTTLEWRGVVLASIPVSLWAVVQATGHDVFEWQDIASWCGGMRPFSTLGHPTQLGVFLAAVTVFALEQARRARGFLIVAALSAFVCLATMSRAGWLALGLGVAVYLVLLGRTYVTPTRAMAGGLGVVSIVGLTTLIVGAGPLLERVTTVFVAPTRLALWKSALAGFSERPWLGFGFDAFVLVDQQYRQPMAWKYEWGSTANHAHASVANVLATQGLLGLAVLAFVVVLVLRRWWLRRVWSERPAEVSVVIALAVTSLVTFHGVLNAALLGVAVVKTLSVSAPLEPQRWPRWLGLPVVGLLGLMITASCLGRELAMRLEPWNPMWPALAGLSFEKAGRLVEARAAYEEGVRRVPTLAVSLANVGRVASQQGDAAAASAAFERALRLAPLDARIALTAAEANARLGQLDLAAGTLERVLVTYPSDGPAWLALGRVRVLQGRPIEARAMLEASLEADWRDWPEGLGPARELLGALLVESGDLERSLRVTSAPRVAELAQDICGAPLRLR